MYVCSNIAPNSTRNCKLFTNYPIVCVVSIPALVCLMQSDGGPDVLAVEAPGGYPFKLVGREKEGKGAWI